MQKRELKEMTTALGLLFKQEEEARQGMKSIYDTMVVKYQNEKEALRSLRQIYFHIQKRRIRKLLKDRMEFHPFFTAAFNDEEINNESD